MDRFVLAAQPFALVVIYELRVWPSSVRGRPPGIETERRTSATLRPYHASSDFLVYSVLPRFAQGVSNARYGELTAHTETYLFCQQVNRIIFISNLHTKYALYYDTPVPRLRHQLHTHTATHPKLKVKNRAKMVICAPFLATLLTHPFSIVLI
jgi:hypothetical protein